MRERGAFARGGGKPKPYRTTRFLPNGH
ncbi:hypothetical protein CBM2585_A40335 [Cupriavidus taiwanensis]|nr:hypothetical protein CBM2585_A40335 [Cupriavidus taiwanensis]